MRTCKPSTPEEAKEQKLRVILCLSNVIWDLRRRDGGWRDGGWRLSGSALKRRWVEESQEIAFDMLVPETLVEILAWGWRLESRIGLSEAHRSGCNQR